MDRAQKLLGVASSLGLLIEVKRNLFIILSIIMFVIKFIKLILDLVQNRNRIVAFWPGFKLTFYSSVLLWTIYKWMKLNKPSIVISLFLINKSL